MTGSTNIQKCPVMIVVCYFVWHPEFSKFIFCNKSHTKVIILFSIFKKTFFCLQCFQTFVYQYT